MPPLGSSLTFALAAALSLSPCFARELVINGSFEAGLGGFVAHVNAEPDRQNPHSGNWCVRVEGKAGQNNFAQQDVAVEAGRSYRLTVWVRCEGVPAGADAKVYTNVYAGDKLLGSFTPLPRIAGTSDWREQSCEVTMPELADKCSLILQLNAATGTLWFDDLSFIPLLSPEEQAAEAARGEAQTAMAARAFTRSQSASEVLSGVRFSEDPESGELFLASGRTAITLGPGAEGFPLRSLVDLPTQTEFIVPGGDGKLFSIELRAGQPYTYSGGFAGPGPGSHHLETADGTARLILDYEPHQDVKAQVTIAAGADGLLRWRIDVEGVGRAVWLVDFPCIDRLGAMGDRDSEYLALPSGQGYLQRDPRRKARYSEGWADYPGGGKTMQFEAYCAASEGCGLYVATEDGAMRRKSTSYFGAGDWISHFVRHYPDDMGLCKEYEQPFEVVLSTFGGDWYDACRLYRKWALKQPWSAAGPVATRADMPDWMRQLGAWCQGDMPGTTREDMEPQVQRVGRFAREMQAPVAFHAYIWQTVGRHDANYPILDPKPGFARAVSDMQAMGVRVIPYINVYSADAAGPAWDALNLTDLQLRPALGRSYSDMTGLVSMCVATSRWQEIIRGECHRLMGLLPVDGLYLDQLTGAAYLCFDPEHGHPMGGGSHFADGMRQVAADAMAAVKARRPDSITFGENCCEAYIDKTSALLTWAEMDVDTRLPMFPAVYSDHMIRLGCFIGRPDTWGDGQGYTSKLGLSFTWGDQLGWIMFGILSNFEEPQMAPLRAYLSDLAQTRVAALQYLCHGQMLRPPVLEVPQVPVAWDWFSTPRMGQLPAVLCNAWKAPDGQVGVALCNWTGEDRRVVVPLDPTWQSNGKRPRVCRAGEWTEREGPAGGRLTVTVPAHTGMVLEPGMRVEG